MLQLINASTKHALQILPYFSNTCYWKEFIEHNKLQKSYTDFMLEWIILPRINITKVLVDLNDPNQIYGCLIAGTTEQFSHMPDYTPHLNSKVMEVFNNWFAYQVSDGVILELYAIDKKFRKNGYGKMMLHEVDLLAQATNKNIISCFVWTCFHDSIIATTKNQFTVIDCIKFPLPINKNLGLLYMEKNSNLIKDIDYFQSENYTNLSNLLQN